MQKILILGAGVYQVPLIRKAKELGYYVVVMSIRGNYPGFAYADKVYYVDTTDKVQALKIARAEDVSAVCTTGTDVCVPTIGWICDELKLPGITYDTAMKASNKWLMKQTLLQHGVCTPNGYKVTCIEEASEYFARLNRNAVLKVVDKSGSRGIIHAQTEAELKSAYKECMKITGENYLLIEEYIAGREIGVSGMIQNGKVRCILAHEKIMTQNDGVSIQVGHIFNQSINQSINLAQQQFMLYVSIIQLLILILSFKMKMYIFLKWLHAVELLVYRNVWGLCMRLIILNVLLRTQREEMLVF